jgi:hypothetical protein
MHVRCGSSTQNMIMTTENSTYVSTAGHSIASCSKPDRLDSERHVPDGTAPVTSAAHCRASSTADTVGPPIRIWVLGDFRIAIDAVDVPATRNMPRVPWQLLKCLVAHGNKPIAQARLEEVLWPDSDGDAAYRALVTTAFRLRNLLGRKDALLFRNRLLALNPALCWSDAWEFEHAASNLHDLEHLRRSLELYRGPFLSEACENPLQVAACEQLRRKYLRAVLLVGTDLERKQRPDLAEALYESALDVEPRARVLRERLGTMKRNPFYDAARSAGGYVAA